MNIKDIHDALSTRLVALQVSGVPPISGENFNYEPTEGTLFLEESLIPAGVSVLGISAGDVDRGFGIYQVTVYAPSSVGRSAAQTQADAIADQFPKAAEYTSNGKKVKIIRVEINPGSNIDAWYVIPVSIYYDTIQ